MSERVQKSIMNMKVGMFFYLLSFLLSFISRKVFLDHLGAEFMGLWGVLLNIMSYLNVAELGIGTSITFFLYKPLQQDDHERINEIASILSFLYRSIGIAIAGIGVLVSLSFPFLFSDLSINLFLIYYAFLAHLYYAVIGYVFNYSQLILSANQKQYVVNGYFQSITIAQSLIQIILAYFTNNIFLWISVTFLTTTAGSILFNIRIRKEYPWLVTDIKKGRIGLKQHKEILKKTGQVFIQKIKNLILYRSDDIMVAIFGGVIMSAYYFNYTMLVNKLNVMVNILSDGMNAGIGNLLAEGDKKRTMRVFWELTAIRFFIAGAIIFGFLLYIQPFIICWLGQEYLLSDMIVYLLLFNIFIMLSRGVVEMYIAASGLFQDVWVAWTEVILNISITLCLAPKYGIAGILWGKILSVFFIAMFWKPYFLFTNGLKESVKIYWKGMGTYYFLFSIFCLFTLFIKIYAIDNRVNGFISLILSIIIIYPVLMTAYFFALFSFSNGMKQFISRKPELYKRISTIHRGKTTLNE